MKKSSKLVFILCGLLIAGTSLICDTTRAAEAPPSDAPPQMAPLDEGDPAVTNQRTNTVKQTQQTYQNGQQTEVKVTSGVGTYIVKPNQNVGTSLPGDAQSNSNNPVQWVVKSWGGSKDTEIKDEAPPVLQPNPNPPAGR